MDALAVASHLGMVTHKVPLQPPETIASLRRVGGATTVLVNSDFREATQNYTCAYLLGHYTLVSDTERPGSTPDFTRDYPAKSIEPRDDLFAHAFASHLLMPEELVLEAWTKYSRRDDITSVIAASFCVPETVLVDHTLRIRASRRP